MLFEPGLTWLAKARGLTPRVHRSPRVACAIASAAVAAVSVRNTRGPSLTAIKPAVLASSISALLNPPSGPWFEEGTILGVSAEVGQITDAPGLDCIVNFFLFLVE